jgi:YndJ-like protein
MNALKRQAALGFSLWLTIIFLTSSSYQKADWHIRILELASLVWLPLGLHLLENIQFISFSKTLKNSILATAICLIVALESSFANHAIFAFPYVVLTFILAAAGVENWIIRPRSMSNTTLSVSLLMLPVASLWAVSHCFDYQPLGFPSEIVTLTAVHFHFAGFVFILACGLAAFEHQTKLSEWACRLAIAAVPLTALGITITQLSNNYFIETCAAVCVTLAGFCCAISYILYNGAFDFALFVRNLRKEKGQNQIRYGNISAKRLTITSKIAAIAFGLVLIFSMSLAFLYAIRPYYTIAWLNIPYMKAIHGTCNGILVPLFLFWRTDFSPFIKNQKLND